jgi:hypothetical protein
MSARLQDRQPDLLHRAAVSANRDRLQAEVRVTVLALLKQLLSECVPGVAEIGSVDE